MKLNHCIIGDCRDGMRQMIAEGVRVNAIITSPPYWGLRDYKIPPSVWGGDPDCAHEWADVSHAGGGMYPGEKVRWQNTGMAPSGHAKSTSGLCRHCGAWRGCLGLEPDYRMFVDHIVEVFNLARELLTDDGLLFMNMGDSYATGAGSVGAHPGGGAQGARWKGDIDRIRDDKRGYRGDRLANGRGDQAAVLRVKTADGYRGGRNGHEGKHGYAADGGGVGPMTQPNRMPQAGLKPKDLCMIPARVAIALQADGWYLRSQIPWAKRNCMPESAQDRPTTAVEYVYMFAKSERYFFDAEPIKITASDDSHARYARARSQNHKYADGGPGGQTITRTFDHMTKPVSGWDKSEDRGHNALLGRYPSGASERMGREAGWRQREPYVKSNDSMNEALRDMVAKRNRRNSDWFFESWQGLLLDDDDEPLALVVNGAPYKGAHFATYPKKLIEPLVLSATSAHGHCPTCGAGWRRVIAKGAPDLSAQIAAGGNAEGGYAGTPQKEYEGTGAQTPGEVKARTLDSMRASQTIGWYPRCDCYGVERLPDYPKRPRDAEKVPEWEYRCEAVRQRHMDLCRKVSALPVVTAVVFDPFFGSGTTGEVAQALGRNWLACDMSEDYEALQHERAAQQGLTL